MRFIKVPSKRVVPQEAAPVVSAPAPAPVILEAEEIMSRTDERDDAAPIGSIAAQDVVFKDVSPAMSPVQVAAERSRSGKLFDKLMSRGKSEFPSDGVADAVAKESSASSSVEKKRVTLDWQEAQPSATLPAIEPALDDRLPAEAKSSSFESEAARAADQVVSPSNATEPGQHFEPEVADAAGSGTALLSEEVLVPEKSADSYVPAPDAKATGSRFSKFKSRKDSKKPGSSATVEAPIRVLIGFLPEVSPKDAAEFAQGIAAKHFDNLGLAYYDAFKLDNGYAYEVHEGGSGRAYLPEVIKYYKSLGAFNPEDDNKVVIRTGTRAVEVSRARNGLSAVLLPEDQKPAMAPWMRPTDSMRPAINKRTGLLVAGAVVFITGFIAVLAAGSFFRLQPYDAPVPTKLERIDFLKLPLSQWPQLQASPQDRYVKALRFEKGNWRIETEAAGAPAAPPAPEAPASVPLAPGATPATAP